MRTRVPTNKAGFSVLVLGVSNLCYITQNQLVVPEQISAHATTLIKPGHIQVKSWSDSSYYPGQWVIQASDTDLVSTLIVT